MKNGLIIRNSENENEVLPEIVEKAKNFLKNISSNIKDEVSPLIKSFFQEEEDHPKAPIFQDLDDLKRDFISQGVYNGEIKRSMDKLYRIATERKDVDAWHREMDNLLEIYHNLPNEDDDALGVAHCSVNGLSKPHNFTVRCFRRKNKQVKKMSDEERNRRGKLAKLKEALQRFGDYTSEMDRTFNLIETKILPDEDLTYFEFNKIIGELIDDTMHRHECSVYNKYKNILK